VDITKTINVPEGRYVVAVSGGVDSMALLHMLKDIPGLQLTVAHFDHGIRSDSDQDRRLVQEISQQYRLPFVYKEGKLGPETSEETAREARYEFLKDIQKQVAARAIITAHHQDDVIETAIHNILRGTGRKGLSSLKSTDGIIRPLLHLPKSHLHTYAKQQNLLWREDSTNTDITYKRNYIRHVVIPKLKMRSPEKYRTLVKLIRRQHDLNKAIDNELSLLLHTQTSLSELSRKDVIRLPHMVGKELVAAWLRQNGVRTFNQAMLERITISFKTARAHSVFTIDANTRIFFELGNARLLHM